MGRAQGTDADMLPTESPGFSVACSDADGHRTQVEVVGRYFKSLRC